VTINDLSDQFDIAVRDIESIEEENRNLETTLMNLRDEVEELESSRLEIEEKVDLLQQVKIGLVSRISELSTEIETNGESIKSFYEKEKDMYDSCDLIAIKFLRALEDKDVDTLNILINDDYKALIEDDCIIVDPGDETIWIGNLSYDTIGFTVHGFRYREDLGMLVIACQILYSENGEMITPPTYIDLGFEIDGDFPTDLIIDWIQHDI
jgi:hypothetical protein